MKFPSQVVPYCFFSPFKNLFGLFSDNSKVVYTCASTVDYKSFGSLFFDHYYVIYHFAICAMYPFSWEPRVFV